MPEVISVNPANGESLPHRVSQSTPEEVAASFRAAREAQKDWADTSFAHRKRACLKVRRYLAANADRAARVVSETNGKTYVDALQTEVVPCLMAVEWYANNADSILASHSIGGGHPFFANKRNTLQYLPVGVVGIISPWNYPFAIPFGEVIMGLMAGNAVLLKVATPSVLVGEFIAECIAAGGLPDGLFAHLVVSGSQCSKQFLANKIDKIFFTGSVPVGKQLMREASDSLTPLSLELGGNDPAIVLDDANLERTSNGIIWAAYQNCGQSCGAVERVYVDERVYAPFLAHLKAKTKALRHGDPSAHPEVELGAITTKGQLETIKAHMKDALDKGAVIEAESQPVGDISKGLFHPAVLLTNVTDDMLLVKEETFGPLLPVMKYSMLSDAVKRANNDDLALTSSVWTESTQRFRKIAERLETGVTTQNDHLYTHGCAETPWGGWKRSGLGRTHGSLGLREMCNAKVINTEMLPSYLAPRNLWWYGNERSVKGFRGMVSFLAPSSVADFFNGVSAVVAFSPKMLSRWEVPDAPLPPACPVSRLVTAFAVAFLPVAAGCFYYSKSRQNSA